jgi:hypothetical protein
METDMGKCITVMILLFVCLSFPLQSASAATKADFVQKYVQQANKHTSRFVDQALILKSKPSEEWTAEELQHYLANSLWAVYSATMAYVIEQGEVPQNLGQVRSAGYLATWPENPFTNWSPMEVVTLADGFSPGNLCLQVCPSEYFSHKGADSLAAQSYELAVYGPDENFATLYGAPSTNELNTWAVVPSGAAYMVGTYSEPAVSANN